MGSYVFIYVPVYVYIHYTTDGRDPSYTSLTVLSGTMVCICIYGYMDIYIWKCISLMYVIMNVCMFTYILCYGWEYLLTPPWQSSRAPRSEYVCVCICLCVCIGSRIYVCIHVCLYTWLCIHAYIYVYIYINKYRLWLIRLAAISSKLWRWNKYIYIYIHIYIIHIYIYIYIYIYINIYVWIYVYKYIHIYIHTYIYIYVYIYIHIYIYKHILTNTGCDW
jgi:hypothetical protein